MAGSLLLRGIELRYVLTINLALHGPATIPTLVESLTNYVAAGCSARVLRLSAR